MRILPCGDAAVMVEVADLDEVHALHAALTAKAMPWIVELVPAERTLLVRIDPHGVGIADVERVLRGLRPRHADRPDRPEVRIPVVYDGADLDAVGEMTGLGSRGVVAAHTGQTWTVAFAGFAPGFGYLCGQDERLQVRRRASPRTSVPAGAVALAGAYSGVYPRTSPGGWQLIGRTEVVLWDLDRDPPALLEPGTRVSFQEAP